MTLIAIDTETGGLDPTRHALLSIALVELSDTDLKPTDRQLQLFILPALGTTIEPDAARINGYTPELWYQRQAIPLWRALSIVQDWLPAEPRGLAHNAAFDYGFLIANEDRVRISTGLHCSQSPPWICSRDTFRDANASLKLGAANHKLATLAAMCGHWGPDYVRGDHQAIDDALACAAGYRWLVNQTLGALLQPGAP